MYLGLLCLRHDAQTHRSMQGLVSLAEWKKITADRHNKTGEKKKEILSEQASRKSVLE